MSQVFNYDAPKAAKIYDKLRKPIGVGVIAGLLHVHSGKLLTVCYHCLCMMAVCPVARY